jgi:hypothetical protein
MQEDRTLREWQDDLIKRAHMGYPILLAGMVYFVCMTGIPYFVSSEWLPYIWIVGMGSIFPFGILLSSLLKVELITKDNPLGTLGGIAGGVQAFFIPVFIIIAKLDAAWVPCAIGLLGGSHFLPYMWIYRSKAYLFVTLCMTISSFILSFLFLEHTYKIVPAAIALTYGIAVLLIFSEMKQVIRSGANQEKTM